ERLGCPVVSLRSGNGLVFGAILRPSPAPRPLLGTRSLSVRLSPSTRERMLWKRSFLTGMDRPRPTSSRKPPSSLQAKRGGPERPGVNAPAAVAGVDNVGLDFAKLSAESS